MGWRRCRARSLTQQDKWIEILGFGPNNKVIGWWDGTTTLVELDPDEATWTQPVKYI